MRTWAIWIIAAVMIGSCTAGPARSAAPVADTQSGRVRGALANGVASFKGIPFAAPPVGDLRWRPPQPPAPWAGVRAAHQFGARAMQLPVVGDTNFRSNG